jgi:hypothetical protein
VVTEQVLDLPPVEDLVSALRPSTDVVAFDEAVALGFGDAVALGVTLAWANPANMRELAAVAAIRADRRTTPGRLIRINVGTPRQIRRHRRHAAPGLWIRLVRTSMTTMSLIFS